jgi:hypothetical protein
MHIKRAGVGLGALFNVKRRSLLCGQGWCVSDENGNAEEEDQHLSGRGRTGRCSYQCTVGMASLEVAGMASVGETLTADGAGLAAGRLPAAEGAGFEAGVE